MLFCENAKKSLRDKHAWPSCWSCWSIASAGNLQGRHSTTQWNAMGLYFNRETLWPNGVYSMFALPKEAKTPYPKTLTCWVVRGGWRQQ